MVALNDVSQTALLTLKARVLESGKAKPVINDPKGCEIFDNIQSFIPAETYQRVLDRKFPPTLSIYLALRARKYDMYTGDFVEKNNGLVVSLGCGFDTRYWRVPNRPMNYLELDLPEVISLKKKVLGGEVEYQMLGSSVLDLEWMERIAAIQTENILFLAEGLFMYLPENEVIRIFQELGKKFSKSQIVFEIVHKKYTRGFRKKIVESKMKRNSGTEAGSAFIYGLNNAREIESYSDNIKVTDEWSYFEDPDIRPKLMRVFRHFKSISKIQYTIKARID